MKNIKLLLLAIVALGFATACTNQTSETSKTTEEINYIALAQRLPQLKALSITAEEMKEADQERYGEFHVVLCGENVKLLADQEKMQTYLEAINEAGLKVFACGFSLNQFNVAAESLVEGIGVVDNGFAYSLNMKKAGAYSIDQ